MNQDFERVDEKNTVEEIINRIEIRELPVFPALFRGELGGDCSTSHSWTYPLSPFDRIFSVTIGEKEVGYVGGTMVTVNGKPTFYLRDVASGNLKAKHIEQIWSGFYHAQKLLGVEQIILANEKKLHDVNNTAEFQTEIHKWYQQDKKSASIVYNPIDVQIRAQFLSPKVSSSGYDSAEGNTYGILMQERPEVLQQYRVEQIENKVIDYKPIEKLSKQNIYNLLLRALNGDSSYLEDVREEQRFQFVEMQRSFLNVSHYALDAYYSDVEKHLQQHDISLSQKLVHDWQDLFAAGHLIAEDSVLVPMEGRSPWLKWTVDFVVMTIMRSPNSDVAYQAVRRNPSLFQESEKFKSMVESIITPHGDATVLDPVARERLRRLLDAGIDLCAMFNLTVEQIKMLIESSFGWKFADYYKIRRIEQFTQNPLIKIEKEYLNSLEAFFQAEKILDSVKKHGTAEYSATNTVAAILIRIMYKFNRPSDKAYAKKMRLLAEWKDHSDISSELREYVEQNFGSDIKKYVKLKESNWLDECENKLTGSTQEPDVKRLRQKFLGKDEG